MKKFLCVTTILLAVLCFTTGQVTAATTTYTCAVMDDTRLDQRDPAINFGTGTTIKIVGDPASAEVCRALMRFNIPPFITAAQIESATLHLVRKNGDDLAINIHPVTPPEGTKWFEKDLKALDNTTQLVWGATWNSPGGEASTFTWTTPGGDYDAAQSASATIVSTNDIDITTLVADNLDAIRKYGILMKMQDESLDQFCSIYSRDNAGSNPYLELVVDLGLPAGTYMCPTIKDVYIDEQLLETSKFNLNWKTRITISRSSSKGIARGLWQFDIPAEIEDSAIESATMYLSGSEHAQSTKSFNIKLYALDNPFNEETIIWGTLAGGGYDTIVDSTGHLPGTFNGAGTNWYAEIDVTTLMSGNLDKVRNNGMLAKMSDETTSLWQNIASRECFDDTDIPAYLKIVLAEETVISLSSFDAVPANNKVTLQWVTESEIDNAGFNIYRAEAGGEYVKINDTIIAAQGSSTTGATYEFVDKDVQNRETYSYKLEDVDINGTATQHGPVTATPRFVYVFKK